ncbi:serine protease snake-like [Sitodiplosis mosellana]|uniref:serine protease snake-like n=1 Tax=Sitodiplosis mosellana TaxID=263140 RepID=UPI0024442293|nr:serine protease snake-like [Sitodiplosis mosellana]XP_055312104.1 serine protease snake-like [Sitodiplosis mosellana]XP_055312105.1 serine protease snake-like [Sitodiplosis mosellana]
MIAAYVIRLFGAVTIAYIVPLFSLAFAENVGDSCQVARSGTAGVCKIINDCPAVIDEIVSQGLFPAKCGFRGRDQIVCCPVPRSMTTTTTPAPTRISQRKCKQYEDAKFDRVFTNVGFNDKPILETVERCTFSIVPLVVGGEVANSGEFPHMALIGYERNFETNIIWGCGGSLISEEFVLTAAHCVETSRYEGRAKYVLLGEHDLSNDKNDRPLQVEIAEKFPHPEFKRSAKYFDIALVKMGVRVTFNPYRRPACLPHAYDTGTGKAIATGWGRIDFRGPSSQVLQKVILELFTEDECNATYLDAARTTQLRYGILPAQQFCAGSHTEKKDTCQGDSGGPLQTFHPYVKCMYTIAGITSFAKQCGDLNAPGVYTRVYNFLDWIENIVWPNQ